MGDPVQQAGSAGRDADLGLSSAYYEPLAGSQAQPDPFQSFQNDYYSAGGALLNPSYNNAPLFSPQPQANPVGNTNFMQNTNKTIDQFGGQQDYGILAPAPTFNPKVSGAMSTPGASILSQPYLTQGTSSVSQAGASGPTAQAGSGSPSFGSAAPTGKTGAGSETAGPIDKIFGSNGNLIKQLLGLGGAAAVDKLVKVPAYPDMTSAAQRIMSQGPLTPAGQEADRRLVSYLQQGPKMTPLSEEYIASVSKMFDDELQHQLQIIDTKMQASGAGGFGGGSGDSQYLRAQLINKYSLEKTYYLQKLMDERLRADLDRYYQTLNKVYGISTDELQALANLQVEELAAQFKLDYQDATELKQALGDMLYQATQDDYSKYSDNLAKYGQRVLDSVTGTSQPAGGV